MNKVETLEFHFFDWKNYSHEKMKKIFEYIILSHNNIIWCDFTYFVLDSDWLELADRIYEYPTKSIHFDMSEDSNISDISELLGKSIVYSIIFLVWDGSKKRLYVNFSNWKVYYSFEINDVFSDWFDNFFAEITPIYKELICIFEPRVSNFGEELLWEDIDRIKKDKYFEWIFGYLAYEYDFDFLKYEKRIDLDNGFLFVNKK
jgi:hypothetical protein